MGNCAGIDWASEKHDVLIEDPAGVELLAATFSHDEDGVSALCAALACFDVEVVAIERPEGLFVGRPAAGCRGPGARVASQSGQGGPGQVSRVGRQVRSI
jgi:hypothetical protein